jgi:hypothetical protein
MSINIKEILNSVDIGTPVNNIGEKFGLNIDQEGDLYSIIAQIINGSKKSKDFVEEIINNLSIERDLANKITAEVNQQIFQKIKERFQMEFGSFDVEYESASQMEKIGNFTIVNDQEQRDGSSSDIENTESREEIIQNIENPIPAPRKIVNEYPKTDPLVDHLLTTPTIVPPQRIESKEGEAPKPPVSVNIPKRSGPDPYREPIN